MDLDQAVHIERRGSGYRVRYAIADVAPPSSCRAGRWTWRPTAVARRSTRRTRRRALYPPQLSEGAASLLPDQDEPALV